MYSAIMDSPFRATTGYLSLKTLADHVDAIQAAWARTRPDLDTSPAGIVGRVGRAGRLLDAGISQTFARHGLSRGSFDVLAALRRSPPEHRLSPTELYQSLMRTSGAMTQRLHRLEGDGLVARVPDPIDGRSTLVELTPAGRELIDGVLEEHLATERGLLSALTAAEQDALAGLLRKLLIALEADPSLTVPRRCRQSRRRTTPGDR